MINKPLGIVKEILESIGIGISYVYDDLIFVDHNDFLLQFTDKKYKLLAHVNKEADEEEAVKSINLMNNVAASRNMVIVRGKYYTLVQADEENVRLEFTETRD